MPPFQPFEKRKSRAPVLVKQPIEYVVGALRSLGVRPSRLATKESRY